MLPPPFGGDGFSHLVRKADATALICAFSTKTCTDSVLPMVSRLKVH